MKKRLQSNQLGMRITKRDLKIFQKLNAAGWLTTHQLQRYFFPEKSMNAVCKRLRKLAAGNYIAMSRISSTEAALYRLAGQGRLALLEQTRCSEEEIAIPTQVPHKVGHFTAINDLRFNFEKKQPGVPAELLYFFSERELCRYYKVCNSFDTLLTLLSTYKILPDAVAKLRVTKAQKTCDLPLLIEYDEGTEHAAFFGRTKVKQYAALLTQNYERVGDIKVVTFARSVKRIVSLMRQAVLYQAPRHLFYFALLENLEPEDWLDAEILLDPDDYFVPVRKGNKVGIWEKENFGEAVPKHALITLPAVSPRSLSPRGEMENRIILDDSTSYDRTGRTIYLGKKEVWCVSNQFLGWF